MHISPIKAFYTVTLDNRFIISFVSTVLVCSGVCCFHNLCPLLSVGDLVQHAPLSHHSNSILANTGELLFRYTLIIIINLCCRCLSQYWHLLSSLVMCYNLWWV